MCVCACAHVSLCLCTSVCLPLRLFITSGMMLSPYDWLNNSITFYMAAVVDIISRCGLSIDARHGNQSIKCKLPLYEPSIHFNGSLSSCNMTEHVSYKCVWHNMYQGIYIKEGLAWATCKQLRVTSNEHTIARG